MDVSGLKIEKIKQSSTSLLVALLCLLAVNIIVSKVFFRLDVTEDKVYTLSEGSIKIVEELEEPVGIKLYFSSSLRDLPPQFKTYAERVEEVLREYAVHSGGNISVDVIDPKPDTDDEEWARKYGIQPVNIGSVDELYFGVAFTQGLQEGALPYLDPRREEFLEYDISEALVNLKARELPQLGILSSFDMVGTGGPMAQFGGGAEDWVVVQSLRNSFKVQKVETDVSRIPDAISVLLVVHPKDLSDKTLYAIDQFVMGGGRLVVAVDPFSRTDAMLAQRAGGNPYSQNKTSSDLGRLFSSWGITFDSKKMLADENNPTRINAGGQPIDYPFYMTLMDEALNKDQVVTGNLKQVVFGEPGSLEYTGGADYTFEALVKTSESTGTVDASMAAFMPPTEMLRKLSFEDKQRTLMGLLKGKFKSSFPADALPEGADRAQHKAEASGESMMVLIADVDFMYDDNAVDKMRFGPQIIVRPRNDNLNLVVNAADFLGGSPDLISIRTSGKVSRPFTKLIEIQKGAQKQWKAEEERLSKQLTDLQSKLSQLQSERTDGSRTSLSPAQQAEIERFRDEEVKIRKRRREVRKNLREDIETLGTTLKAANLLIVPLIVIGFGIGVFARRAKRAGGK